MEDFSLDFRKNNVNLDEIDFQLIDMLYHDSRTTYADMAKILAVKHEENKLDKKLSAAAIHNRIKSLEERGIIKKFTIQPNSEKLGLDITAIIELQIEVSYLEDVNKELQKIPQIISLYNITGGTDIIAIGRFVNRSHMNDVLRKILKIKHITRTATHLALEILKEELYSPELGISTKSEMRNELEKYHLLNNNSKHEIEVEK